jgi:hypothetical protein
VRVLRAVADAILGPVVPPPPGMPPGQVPEGVVFRRGRLVPAIGGVLSGMGRSAGAVTLGRTIVLHPNTSASPRLVRHELAHVRQWEADALFPLRYMVETLRRGYRANRYETEARAAEDAGPRPQP